MGGIVVDAVPRAPYACPVNVVEREERNAVKALCATSLRRGDRLA